MKNIPTLVLSVLVVSSIGLVLFMYSLRSWPVNLGTDSIYVINIPKGASLNKTLSILEKETDFNHRSILKTAKFLSRFRTRQVQQGEHSIPKNTSIGEIVEAITTPSEHITDIFFPEGKTLFDYAIIIEDSFNIDAQDVIDKASDRAFVRSLGIYETNTLEGYLFPNTYRFHSTAGLDEILMTLVEKFFDEYDMYVKGRDNKTSLGSMKEIVTMASIIQGEAAHNSEMPTISSLYHNRLKKGMRLEADPTVQYALAQKKQRKEKLYFKDYDIKHPYNTYNFKGLPPGPISNPGRDALIAAISPTKTNYIYMVAHPLKRTHLFASTFDEHKKNIITRNRIRKSANGN